MPHPPLGFEEFLMSESESDLAQELINIYGKKLRYCAPLDLWLAWHRRHWDTNPREVEQMLAGDLGKRRALPKKRQRAVLSRAERPAIRKTILGYASYQARQVDPARIEADPMLLNLPNGTLDLRKGELRKHARKDLIIHLANAAWDADAKCPQWDAFIRTICGGEAELVEYVRRCVGYSLTGDVREQVIFLPWGSGANGKSTFLMTLMDLLGTYALAATSELVTKPSGHERELFRARLVVLPEMPDGKRMNEPRVKMLTGGDRIVGAGRWVFAPTHKLWLATNHLPEIRGTEHAIWRRLRPIPFRAQIAEHEQDKGLLQKLRAELPGILRWAVEGCLAWQRDGLHAPAAVKEATQEYRAEQDPVAAFIAERCEVSREKTATAKELYAAYRSWAEESGEATMTQKALGLRLKGMGFSPGKVGPVGDRAWRGIALPAPPATLNGHDTFRPGEPQIGGAM